MTCTITTHSAAARASRLVRRVDGTELPVAGTWYVPGNHASISLSVPRRLRRSDSRTGRAREATLVFSNDPDDVLVTVLFEAPGSEVLGSPRGASGPPMHLEGRSVRGAHPWTIAGTVVTAERRALRLGATLDYCGVWRRGFGSYGWFVLVGGIEMPAGSPQRTLRFSFDLLASGPDPHARPASASSGSTCIRRPEQTRGAA